MSHQFPRGERILVTGGAGFIGSTFIRQVIDDNDCVILDTFGRDALSLHEGLADHPRLTVHRGSVLDPEAVAQAMRGATIVVHCAAVAGIDSVGRHPTRTMSINVIGTWRVLEAAVAAGGVKRFVDFSTSEVFGTHAWKVKETDPTVVAPVGESRWTYAVSKLATEHMAHAYHDEFGLPVACLRPFNVYGPRQVGEGAIQRFVAQARAGGPIRIYNDGSQVRAWCYVQDAVSALGLLCVHPAAVGQSFNIGNPAASISVLHLAELVARLSGGVPIEHVRRDGPDVELRVPDVSKARTLLGWEPAWGLEAGLRETMRWLAAQESA